MPLVGSIGRTVGTAIKATRLLVRGSVRGGAWATRRVGSARANGAANEIGMIRLFDLHAISCAGDTLITIGLAGTVFFSVPLGEARSKVALYLLITMVPFALLAPVVGPLLDRFRHGRRYALAVTMLGRAFLAFVISDHLGGWALYPAAFGVLALSRAYGVARSAAVPRLLPAGIGLSQAGARASVYGTFAGALVAPIGLLAVKFGPQWSLRVAAVLFIVGMVISLRLPPRADSDPPEAVPRPWRSMLRLPRGADRPLSGRLVVSTLLGSASLRLLYGFLLLFLTFVIVGKQLDTTAFGRDLGRQGAISVIGGALAVGTFLSTAVGTRLRIRRPLALQSVGLACTAAMAVAAALFYSLPLLALLALVTAIFSGIAKLAIDASIQERVPERMRASAFAHSETVLMIAWVLGGALGIIPLSGRLGVGLAAVLAVCAAVRAGFVAVRLHDERLSGRANDPTSPTGESSQHSSDQHSSDQQSSDQLSSDQLSSAAHLSQTSPVDPWPDAPTAPGQAMPPAPRGPLTLPAPYDPTRADRASSNLPPGNPTRAGTRAPNHKPHQDPPAEDQTREDRTLVDPTRRDQTLVDQSRVDQSAGRKWRLLGRRQQKPARTASPVAPATPPTLQLAKPQPEAEQASTAPPGFHVYRPSSAAQPPSGAASTNDANG